MGPGPDARRRKRRVVPEDQEVREDEEAREATTAPSVAVDAERARRSPALLDRPAVVRLQANAGNRALTSTLDVQRRGPHRGRAPGAPHVGATDEGFVLDTVAPGRAGFASRMMAEAGEMAESIRAEGGLDQLLVRQVAPDISGVDRQERVVSRAKQLWLDQKSGWATGSTNALYEGWADACQRWLDGVAGDKRQLQQHAASFNAFAPRANSFFVSMARLSSMQSLLGATDNQSLAAALTDGLGDARRVAERYRDVMEGSDVGGPETLDVPAPDESVESAAADVTVASRELNTTYLGFRRAATAREIEGIEAEGTSDRARLAEINEVKKFVRQVGSLVDTSMSVVSGAPAAVTNVTAAMRRTEAQFNAVRNRRAILRGERPRHNPTYVTTDDEGNMLIANAQTRMQVRADQFGEEGAEKTPIPSSGVSLPASVEDILGGITDFIYAGEVREINMRLQAIADRVSAVKNWERSAAIVQATQEFRDKLNEFALRCAQLQQRVAARRNAYLSFGIQLDRFARADQRARREGLGTQRGHERYASIMAAVSQVRELLALGASAQGGFGSSGEFGRWAREIRDRRQSSSAFSHRASPGSSGPYWTVPSYDITPGEMTAIESIFGQATRFENAQRTVAELFGTVDAAARDLFTDARVSPGGGSGSY